MSATMSVSDDESGNDDASNDRKPGDRTPLQGDEDDPLAKHNDPELEKNGGDYTCKFSALQITFRCPVKSPVEVIALLYGFLPFIIPALFFFSYLATNKFMSIYGFSLSIIAALINEGFLKPLFNEPRPIRSANREYDKETGKWKMKHGMPSGHVFNATLILVWSSLEVAFRGPGWGDQAHVVMELELLALIWLVMAPVPWARWYNGDHSVRQCIAGGLGGVITGMAAYIIRTEFFGQFWAWDCIPISANSTSIQCYPVNTEMSWLPPWVNSSAVANGNSTLLL